MQQWEAPFKFGNACIMQTTSSRSGGRPIQNDCFHSRIIIYEQFSPLVSASWVGSLTQMELTDNIFDSPVSMHKSSGERERQKFGMHGPGGQGIEPPLLAWLLF